MTFSEKIKTELAKFHLLEHPFYQAWNEGTVSKERLKRYAKEYYPHVEAFPRYISAAHSLCEDTKARELLLENLNDEEGLNGTPHPELWRKFAIAVGNDEKKLKTFKEDPLVNPVIDNFFKQCRSSYPQALASIYAYEYQVPEVATTKIKGLKEHYGVTSKEGLAFFTVHEKADVYHRKVCEGLLDELVPSAQEKALEAARTTAKSLWDFLTAMNEVELEDAA